MTDLDAIEQRAAAWKANYSTARDAYASAEDVPELVAAFRTVLELHRMVEVADYSDPTGQNSFPACGECYEQNWPCKTVQALAGGN